MRTAYVDPLDRQIDRAVANDLPALERLEMAVGALKGLCRELVAKRHGLFVDPVARVLTHDGKQLPPILPTHADPRDAPLDTEGTRLANLSSHLHRIEEVLGGGIAVVSGVLSEAATAAEIAVRLDAAGWPGGLCRDCGRWQPPGDGIGGQCRGGLHPAGENETCEYWEAAKKGA
jgi:hypothetical protein